MLPKKIYLYSLIWTMTAVSFLLFSAFLILRASGFVINLKAKTLEKTSLIVVNSSPKGALLYINDKFKEKTPSKLAYLKPGYYHLKIEKEGYQAWEKTEILSPSEFIEENAVLFYAEPEIEAAIASEIKMVEKKTNVESDEVINQLPQGAADLSWHKNKKILLYKTDYEIWLYFLDKSEKDQHKIVARFLDKVQKVAFFPDFEHILFVVNGKLRIVELDGSNDTKLLDLPSLDFWPITISEIIYKDGDSFKKAKVR